MRKSNWLIIGILAVASVVYLVAWYVMGLDKVDAPFDLVITVVWWVVIVAACLFINWSESKRRRSIRTSFLAPGLIYNPEAGIVRIDTAQSYTPALQQMLGNLDYDFEDQESTNDQRIRFTFIVRSDKFSDGGNTWMGEVVKVSNPNEVHYFQNKRELARLIDAA